MSRISLKLGVIILLVAINLSLLGIMVMQHYQSSRFESSLQNQTLEYLASRGITVKEQQIPWQSNVYPRTVIPDPNGDRKAAESLVGNLGEDADMTSIWYGDNGSMTLLPSGAFSISLQDMTVSENKESAAAVKILAGLKYQAEVEEVTGDEMLRTVRTVQCLDSNPVYNCTAAFQFRSDGMIEASGMRLPGETVRDLSSQMLNASTILVRFANSENRDRGSEMEIQYIEEGYLFRSESNTLSPVWMLQTDRGAYQVDCITGEVLPMSLTEPDLNPQQEISADGENN